VSLQRQDKIVQHNYIEDFEKIKDSERKHEVKIKFQKEIQQKLKRTLKESFDSDNNDKDINDEEEYSDEVFEDQKEHLKETMTDTNDPNKIVEDIKQPKMNAKISKGVDDRDISDPKGDDGIDISDPIAVPEDSALSIGDK
jgi:hypothetical protein